MTQFSEIKAFNKSNTEATLWTEVTLWNIDDGSKFQVSLAGEASSVEIVFDNVTDATAMFESIERAATIVSREG